MSQFFCWHCDVRVCVCWGVRFIYGLNAGIPFVGLGFTSLNLRVMKCWHLKIILNRAFI